MKKLSFMLALIALLFMVTVLSQAATKYVITNDDNPAGNSASIYAIGDSGDLSLITTILTGGFGQGGGYYAAGRVNVLRSKTQNCAYIGDAVGPSNYRGADVASIDMGTLKLVGTYPANPIDSGTLWGIGLAKMYGPPPDCKRFEVERRDSPRKCIRPLGGDRSPGTR